MQPGDAPQKCLLCNRNFCEKHKGTDEGVCEVNHGTYYQRHHRLPNVYPTLEARAEALGQETEMVWYGQITKFGVSAKRPGQGDAVGDVQHPESVD